jgi:hypothetical protein
MLTILYMAATPSPKPFNEDTVTPGWVGFTVTFLIGVVVILLIFDMVRRMRRVRYRGEIREQLEAEKLEAERTEADKANGR